MVPKSRANGAQLAKTTDINLPNDARLHLEAMIDEICKANNVAKPRTYRNRAHTDYLNLAKCKKRSKKKIRKAIHKQLQYVNRDLGYVYSLMESYGELPEKKMALLKTIQELYDQQKYMYDNKIHTVSDRIVSISQPYIRPIVRGKAATPVEFGAKLDLSLDETGMARIEKFSYDPYNESEVLISAIERYHERTGHYPERVLADQIYRNRKNLQYCKEHGIRLSGPKLGRPKEDDKADKKLAYKEYKDRIAIERAFALAKHSYGLGRITTKLDETTRSSIALSVIVMNVARIQATFSRSFLTLPADRTVQGYSHRYFSNHRSATILMISKYTTPDLI